MITLWHCADARSFRPLWALEELGLPYDLKMLPFPPRFLAREYLAENPLGTIPLLVDGETRMTESAAIVQYLSEAHGEGRLSV
jgi:glutathione S-transferase